MHIFMHIHTYILYVLSAHNTYLTSCTVCFLGFFVFWFLSGEGVQPVSRTVSAVLAVILCSSLRLNSLAGKPANPAAPCRFL